MRRAYLGLRAILLALPLGFGLWGLSQNPFAQPLLQRSTQSLTQTLEARFHRQFTPDWLETQLQNALEAEEPQRVLWLADLAVAEGRPLPAALLPQIEKIRQQEEALGKTTTDCLRCAWEPAQCERLSHLALCAVPLELSPLGDLNGLRRQGMNYASGTEVDQLELGLSLVGLAATGAILATGGSSALIKAGTGSLRLAKRIGSLPPALARSLTEAADLPIHWPAVLRAAPLEEITDTAKLARLSGMANDLGRIAKNTSTAETLVLMKHLDTPEDITRMARLSEAAGAKTLSRVEVLGKARAFRALTKVSELAIATAMALWAAVVQVLMLLASGVGRLLLPKPKPRPRQPPPLYRPVR